MDAKLTLKLNNTIIERAKQYASARKLSLSRLIESYLSTIILEDNNEYEISPFVKSIASGKSIPEDVDYRKEYNHRLDQKHK